MTFLILFNYYIIKNKNYNDICTFFTRTRPFDHISILILDKLYINKLVDERPSLTLPRDRPVSGHAVRKINEEKQRIEREDV